MARNITRSLGADVAEESGDLLHLRLGAAGGAEAVRLVDSGGGNEGLVVPESDGVGHRSIPLGEEIFKLIGLEKIRYSLIAAVFRQPFTLPPLIAQLHSLHRLHDDLFR